MSTAQPTLVPAEEPQALATAEPEALTMIERLARDPNVDVAKLERLIAMQKDVMRHQAKAAFDAAFSKMQSELPEISERGQIVVKGTLRSTYAKLEDIHAAVRPVLKEYGFAIRHRTEWPPERAGIIRIVGILSHEQGHSEESAFEASMDKSDYRTDIQSMGSTVSYGRRYTMLDLLNISTRGLDDDGQTRPGVQKEIVAPPGFDDWWIDLQAVADNGWGALKAAFNTSDTKLRDHVTKHNPSGWEALKKRAAAVKKSS